MQYTGLTPSQVAESRQKHGSNTLTPAEKESLWQQFIDKFSDPLIIILMVAGMLSIGISFYEYFGLGDTWAVFFEPIGIFVAIFLATGMALFFENKANKEFSLLNLVNDDELFDVVREGNVTQVPKKDIVVGDIVILNTGDEVPADGQLLDAVVLMVDESSLTGEPACSKTIVEADFDKEATYPSNHVLRGSKVLEGHGVMQVTAVGDFTEMGKVFVDAQIDDSVKTPLSEQLDKLGLLISNFSYSIAALVIVGRLIYYFNWNPLAWSVIIPTAVFFWLVVKRFPKMNKKQCVSTLIIFFLIFIGWVIGIFEILSPGADMGRLLAHTLGTIMIAVTLIVVSVPEGLPMAVTLSLAFSMRRMFQTNNLVRKMHACETMGATTVICTDKTGTLTRNRMSVADARFFAIEGNKLSDDKNSQHIREAIAVNSTASLDLSGHEPKALGNPTEGALLLWLLDMGVDYRPLKSAATRVEELPFSTERKYMATIVRSGVDGSLMLYVKGAPEILLDMCTNIAQNVDRNEIKAQLTDYQRRGMRTLAFASCPLTDSEGVISNGSINAPHLTLQGIVAIADPVRSDVPAAVRECLDAGINVKIVTGDTSLTAKEIGRQIGLVDTIDGDESMITGPEFAALSDDELQKRVQKLKIISRARPSDKKRLVEALQKQGEVVAVTGDGTNDAPALNAAHVGLSMGDGTSVAKEASDITIIDNSFTSIGRAVMWGRSLYQNIQRFLLFQLTVNVAACLLVLFGAFIGSESPLTVTQMLWVNLIMDTFGAMALSSLPPSEAVMRNKPRRRDASIITGPMIQNIVGVGLLFFVITIALVAIFEHSDVQSMTDLLHLHLTPENTGLSPYELTLVFSVFVWTHFWYMFCARGFESGRSALSLKGCDMFGLIAAIIVVGQVLIVEVMYEFFNVVPMKLSDWIIIVAGSSLVLWVREIKRLVCKK